MITNSIKIYKIVELHNSNCVNIAEYLLSNKPYNKSIPKVNYVQKM